MASGLETLAAGAVRAERAEEVPTQVLEGVEVIANEDEASRHVDSRRR